jgi:hypothetical protein
MERNINLGNINSVRTHFWAGSLDSHNFHNRDYIKSSKALIDAAAEAECEAYNAMRIELRKKYNMVKKGKYTVNADGNKALAEEFFKELEENKAEFAFTVYNNAVIFNKDQVNTIFNTVWGLAGELSKKYDCAFKGFRFAINGGHSVNINSASISTLNFLWKKNEESWEKVLEKCLKMFAFYIFCYSEEKSIVNFRHECGRKWEHFENWYKNVVAEMITGRYTYLTQLWNA